MVTMSGLLTVAMVMVLAACAVLVAAVRARLSIRVRRMGRVLRGSAPPVRACGQNAWRGGRPAPGVPGRFRWPLHLKLN
ncbi:hypothetical protein GCM10008961_21020 [Deinococcus knuensis]|uniref:Secreted protein n=1 Tax=Deinococcus knuensis TaxID=1837380 RepID=A0ABQ2SH25_9DEIO|nr:hypothetical protein GCM10008961_21020 [Deinococcus knuensis]